MVEIPKKPHGKVIPGLSSATQSAGAGTDPEVFRDAEGEKIWDNLACLACLWQNFSKSGKTGNASHIPDTGMVLEGGAKFIPRV